MTKTITVEVTTDSALARHIEDLRRVITQRNKTIAHLEERLSGEGEADILKMARATGFKEGWKACASALMDQSRKAITSLEDLRDKGFRAYLDGE